MIGVLASEWLKLRSVRSTCWLIGVAAAGVLLAALLAWSGARLWDGLPPARRAQMAPMPVEQVVLPLVQLCLAVLGVLAITAEYATGMIRTSLVVVPRRLALLGAKAPVVAATGLGTVMRSTAGAIVSVVVLWYVLPIVALHLPSPWGGWVAAVMLVNLAPELSGAPQLSAASESLLSPMGALAVMAAYVVLSLGGGAAALLRRDA